MLVVGKIVSEMAAWSDPRESSHETVTRLICVEMRAGSLAKTRSMMEGLAFSAFQVGVERGFRQVKPLSPIQSVKWLAHEDRVWFGKDHRRAWVLKSPIKRVF